ncbi:MAG: hypothetical protein ABIA77_03520 [Candidatus Omnitrophota bacterium]
MKQSSGRTRLFMGGKFQVRYIGLIMILMFVTVLLTGYTVYVTTWIMFGEKLAAVYPQGLLLNIVKQVNMVLLLRMIFLSPLVILIGLVLSHRTAGPMFSIRMFLRNVESGNYDNYLKLRKQDEFHDLAESLNHLVCRLKTEREKRKEKIDLLKQETAEMEAAVLAGKHEKEDLVKKILEFRDTLDDL